MNTIKFKSELMEKIKNGQKLATTRKGVKKNITLGPVVLIDSENNGTQLKSAFVYSIKVVKFRNLKYLENLVWKEGYRNIVNFEQALEEIYGHIDGDENMTVIEWTNAKNII